MNSLNAITIKQLNAVMKFFYFFKSYMLMQFMIMKHNVIYLNSNTEAMHIS